MNINAPQVRLNANLKELRLPTIRNSYQEYANMATQNNTGYEPYLLELTDLELQARNQRRVNAYLKDSRVPLEKTMSTFDRQRLPVSINQQITTLLTGEFIKRTENLLVFGNPGTGKTHLCCALAHELILQGRRFLFLTCNTLIQNLLTAKRDLALANYLKKLDKFDAIIVDDLGYIQYSREEMDVVFAFFAHRYERKSVALTSNLPFSQWETIFKDPITAVAAIDRLVHHSVILELDLPSYRMEASQKNH